MALGMTSCSSSISLAIVSSTSREIPVMLPPWAPKARDKTLGDRVSGRSDHDGNRSRGLLGGLNGGR